MIVIGTQDRRDLQAREKMASERQVRKNNILIFQNSINRGRPRGKHAGSWIDDIAETQSCLILCSACKPRFAPVDSKPPAGFAYDRYLRVSGWCDGCGTPDYQGNNHFFVHEKLLGVSHQLTLDQRAEELERRIRAVERHFPSIARGMREGRRAC